MNNQLVPAKETLDVLTYMAKSATASKFYASLGGEAGIMSIMLLAHELNVPAMQAISGGIWNIQGKVEMSARMMNMKIRQAGHKLKIDMDTQQCTITGTRKDTGEELTVKFSMEDATRAGLANKTVWKQYPREMLFNRCLSIIARMLFPDVIGNCYVEGEVSESLQETPKAPEKKPVKADKIKIAEEECISEYETIVLEDIKKDTKEEVISPEQFQEIFSLVMQGPPQLLKDFLKHYNIPMLEMLPASKFDAAITGVHKSLKRYQEQEASV